MKEKPFKNGSYRLPISVAVISLTFTIFLWSAQRAEQQTAAKRAVESEAANFQRTIETHVTERVLAIERMAERWAKRDGGTPSGEWEADAQRYVSDFGGFQALSYIDQNYYVRRIVPLAGNEPILNKQLGGEERRRVALDAGRSSRKTSITRAITLVQGGKGFVLFSPIYQANEFKGFIAGVFRVENLLDNFLLSENQKTNYDILLCDGDETIYQRSGGDSLPGDERQFWTTTRIIDLHGIKWTAQITPKRQTITLLDSGADKLALLIGTVFSFLLTAAVYLWQQARRQNGIIRLSNERLEIEISARRVVESEQSRLVAILEASEDNIGMADASGKIIYTNRAGRLMMGLPEMGELGDVHVSNVHPQWALELMTSEAIPKVSSEGYWLGETAFLSPDNREIPTSQMILAHKNERGEIEFTSTIARDISVQKQAELELKKSEKRYRDLTEKSLGFISTHDLEGRILSVNRAAAHSIGYQPEELVGRLISDFMPAHKRHFMPQYFAQICRERETTTLLPVVTKDGEQRVWKCSNVLYGEAGETQYILGYAQDITDLKQTEQALEESRQIFERFMNNSPAVSYIKDAAGRFVYASRHLSELFNVPLEDIYGKTDSDFLPEETADVIRRKEKRIIESGEMSEALDLIPMLDGKIHTWQSYKFPIEGGFGQKLVGGVSFDVTERRKLEALLRQTATLQRAILNSANCSIISTDADGKIQTFNQTAEKWLGYGAEEIVGRGPAMIHVAEEIVARAQQLTKELGRVVEPNFDTFTAKTLSQATHVVDEHEWTYVRKDGTKFPVLLSITALRDDAGNITGFLGLGSDITERRQMEEELKHACDAALESARLKSEFLANMSHEIRTPMNGVMGMTELLLDTSLDDFQRSSAETIRSSADALLTIINDILDFSKIEAGKLNFETIDFDLLNTIESTVELFAEQTARKHIELASFVSANVPIALQGDPGRLRQVLTNLVGNAVKFTARGEIILRVEKEFETKEKIRLRFSVSDTGVGIKHSAQKFLFQAFTQADGSTTRKFGGTGLGLAISKQLVELMNGKIKLESEPDKGSIFTFTAEFTKQLLTPADKPVLLPDLKDKRVLIVDDNASNRQILLQQTAAWGMITAETDSGENALELLTLAAQAGKLFDLAILDMEMPEVDGFELARRIKADTQISDVRLILMPSFGQGGHHKNATQSGIAGYLNKPVKQTELFKCIAAVLGETISFVQTENSAKPVKLVTHHTLDNNRPLSETRILVAEDNLVNQKVATLQLERLGYRVDVVANGRLAVQSLKSGNYSLVLMDCQMPEMDGYAATAEIRRNEGNGRSTPVIALTASAMQDEREKCLAAGMDDYLAKPFKQEELQVILKRWLGT